MKNLFFLSALCLSAGFVLGGVVMYAWPLPPEVWASVSNPTADALGFISWILGIIGVAAFVIGWWQERK